MSAAPSFVPAVDAVLLVRQAREMAGARVGRDGVLVVPASRMEERPAAVTVSTGILALDELSGGIPRGALTEICGPASSGRTSVLLSLMVRMTQANEVCALVDASDSFDPQSADTTGVDLKRVLWVRCSEQSQVAGRQSPANPVIGSSGHRVNTKFKGQPMAGCPDDPLTRFSVSRHREEMSRTEQALKATDLLLQGGGFGLVVVDLAGIAPDAARRVPLTSWFRFRRTVENTDTALVVLEQQPYAKTCASLVIQLSANTRQLSVNRPTKQPSHAGLLGGLDIRAEVTRDRQQRKPVQSVAAWETKTQFAV